jgi:hypothetical protein
LQGGFGAGRNHFPLMVCHSRENVKRKPVGVRIIHGDEFRCRVHKCGNKGQVAGKAVEQSNGAQYRGPYHEAQ